MRLLICHFLFLDGRVAELAAFKPMKPDYDIIIAGGGLSGLSLACAMIRSPLRERSILIVERDAQKGNDRTWGFWANRPTLFDAAVSHTWDYLNIVGEVGPQVVGLGDYHYKVIQGLDFYNFARRDLATCPNVHFLYANIESVEDGHTAACITVDGRPIYGGWIFDSHPIPMPDANAEYQHLKMHFRGWEIETPGPAFDPRAVTFLDFRTPQEQEMRFFYVLPFADNRALVEFTVFSKEVLRRSQYEDALRRYLADVLHIPQYRLISEERGSVPITDDPLLRNLGRHVMAIGARAGRVKPSTGYAFMRVQKDSDAIVQSMLLYGSPFDAPDDPDLYDVLDAVLLKVMQEDGGHIKEAFTVMFQRNPIDLILRFLDEEATPVENLGLITSMSSPVFVNAAMQVATHENLLDIMKG